MKKDKKKTPLGAKLLLPLMFILVPPLFEIVMDVLDNSYMFDFAAFIPIFAVIIVFVAVAVAARSLKKKVGSDYMARTNAAVKAARASDETKQKQVSLPMLKRETEEAIHCTCRHGKEKYIYQAQQFYRNGLIDREEYRVMLERYQKLELPEGIVD